MTGTTGSVARRGAGGPNAVKRGELRIYLGAAPGVGKTYAMQGEAHRRLERGTDVVAAVVEAHGREKTAELLEGIPPLGISKGITGYRRAGVDRIKVDVGDAVAMADAGLLERVLANLIDKAPRYAPDSVVRVYAGGVGDLILINVADEGPGIPRGTEEQILNRSSTWAIPTPGALDWACRWHEDSSRPWAAP